MDADRKKQLAEFVAYAKTLDGDEKGEAQVLDRLFRAFSRGGYKEAGAKLEERVQNDRGGSSFADLVWKPIVLIETKKRGEDLSRHLKQAVDYWLRLTPNRHQSRRSARGGHFGFCRQGKKATSPDSAKFLWNPGRDGMSHIFYRCDVD